MYGNYLDEVLTLDDRRGGVTVAQLNDGAGGERLFYHSNTLFHVYALTGEGAGVTPGTVREAYQYDASGTVTVFTGAGTDGVWFTGDDPQAAFSDLDNPYSYGGQRTDSESGLMYHKNRYYGVDVGRFLTRDPIGHDGGVNLYGYADGRVTCLLDPFGLVAGDPGYTCKDGDAEKKTCVVDSITVEWQPGSDAARRPNYLGWFWEIVIKGENLKRCEYTQFISNNTSLWDATGNALAKQAVLDAYKDSDINFSDATNPFAKDQKDDGWGDGAAWAQFTNDAKETAVDHHRLNMPTYADGGDRKAYAYQRKVDLVIKVRDKATMAEVKVHKWGYTAGNYKGAAPKAPVVSKDDVGIYAHY